MQQETIRINHYRSAWFADVPVGCEWIGDTSTSVAVVAAGVTSPKDVVGDRLEMTGRVMVRGSERLVISCGGLIVSVSSHLVDSGIDTAVTVVFKRDSSHSSVNDACV